MSMGSTVGSPDISSANNQPMSAPTNFNGEKPMIDPKNVAALAEIPVFTSASTPQGPNGPQQINKSGSGIFSGALLF
jgi:hypothetical protein